MLLARAVNNTKGLQRHLRCKPLSCIEVISTYYSSYFDDSNSYTVRTALWSDGHTQVGVNIESFVDSY